MDNAECQSKRFEKAIDEEHLHITVQNDQNSHNTKQKRPYKQYNCSRYAKPLFGAQELSLASCLVFWDIVKSKNWYRKVPNMKKKRPTNQHNRSRTKKSGRNGRQKNVLVPTPKDVLDTTGIGLTFYSIENFTNGADRTLYERRGR